MAEALDKLAKVREAFARDYRTMLDDVIARGLPVAVCTIYDARFPDAKQRRLASLGLTIFNDCITREAAARGLALIDLRLLLTAKEDLANPIEPRSKAAPRSPPRSPPSLPIMTSAKAAARCSAPAPSEPSCR